VRLVENLALPVMTAEKSAS